MHVCSDVHASEEAWPVDALRTAHIGAVDVHDFDRAWRDAGGAQHADLESHAVEMMVLYPGAALYFDDTRAIGAAQQVVHAQADVLVREGALEDPENGGVAHESLGVRVGLCVLPGRLCDEHAAGEQPVRLGADLAADVDR